MTARDETIVFKVGVKLKVDPRMDSFGKGIHVSANMGRVTLEGTVPSYDAARAAELVALSVFGVTGVDNQLTIESG